MARNMDKKREYDREYQRKKRNPPNPRVPFAVVTKTGNVARTDLLDSYAAKKEGEETRQMPIDRFREEYKKEQLIQPLYSPETLASIIEVNSYHARACQVKARDTAGLGWTLFPLVDQPNSTDQERLEEFFNNQMGLTRMFYQHQYDVEVISYGALELIREDYKHDGEPSILNHVPAHTLRMHSSGEKVVQIRGNKKRYFKMVGAEIDVDYKTGETADLGSLDPDDAATEIIWNSIYSQRSDYYGVADIVPCLGAVHGDISRRDYNLSFFENFGVPAYAVFITGDYDPGPIDEETGKTDLEERIEQHFGELAKDPHSTLVLTVPSREGSPNDVQIQFQPLAVDVKDASFRLYRKDNRDEVITAHGVPPYRLGIAETGSLGGSTAVESTKIYKSSVIEPRQEILEELINKWIVREGFEVTDWEFKFQDIDTDDKMQDLQLVQALFGMGAMRIRDVIQLYGDQFGIEDDENDERLDTRFIGGQPLDALLAGEDDDNAMKALKAMKRRLLEVEDDYSGLASTKEGRTGSDNQ